MLERRKANKSETAAWFEVHVNTVDSWIRAGCPYLEKGGVNARWSFDLLAVAEWRYSRKSKPDIPAPDSAEFDPDGLAPKDRKDWYEGEKARIACESDMIDLFIKKKTVVFIEDYRNEMARILKLVANGLETCPDKIERKLGLPPEIVVALQDEIDAIRSIIHNELTVLYGDPDSA